MSELGVNPLGGLPADVGESIARDHAATLVLGEAVSVDEANRALEAKGFAPLNPNSAEYFQVRKEALLKSDDFIRAYSASDPDAIASLYEIDLRIGQAVGKLTDAPARPTSAQYEGLRNAVASQLPTGTKMENVQSYGNEMATLASSIGMPADSAKAFAEDHIAAVYKTAAMTPEELATFGDQETATLHAAIGEDAQAKIKEASRILSQKSGRTLDLAKIARTNGARVAVNFYFQSQVLALKK